MRFFRSSLKNSRLPIGDKSKFCSLDAEWFCYNTAAGSFRTKKLSSRCYTIELVKIAKLAF